MVDGAPGPVSQEQAACCRLRQLGRSVGCAAAWWQAGQATAVGVYQGQNRTAKLA